MIMESSSILLSSALIPNCENGIPSENKLIVTICEKPLTYLLLSIQISLLLWIGNQFEHTHNRILVSITFTYPKLQKPS